MIIPYINTGYPSFSKFNWNNCLLPIEVLIFFFFGSLKSVENLKFSLLIRNKFLFHTFCLYRVLNIFDYYMYFSWSRRVHINTVQLLLYLSVWLLNSKALKKDLLTYLAFK